MIKEYRTIEEVAGPLMLVKNVEGVAYDELGEVELPDGSRRRCKVLEINGNDALVQLVLLHFLDDGESCFGYLFLHPVSSVVCFICLVKLRFCYIIPYSFLFFNRDRSLDRFPVMHEEFDIRAFL